MTYRYKAFLSTHLQFIIKQSVLLYCTLTIKYINLVDRMLRIRASLNIHLSNMLYKTVKLTLRD